MKLINIFKRGLLVCTLIGAASCSNEFLDHEVNPAVPQEGTLSLVLTNAEVNIGANFSLGTDIPDIAAVFSRQTYTINRSTYGLTAAFYATGWHNIYSGGLKDLKYLIDEGEKPNPEDATKSNINLGYAAIARILSAYAYKNLVDAYGDIPYTEALQGETIILPSFDSGEFIYDELLKSLDIAIQNLETTIEEKIPVEGDLYYSGDYLKWIKLANTIKLAMYMNISKVDPAKATAGIQAIMNPPADEDGKVTPLIITDNSDDFVLEFFDSIAPNTRHPSYNENYDTSPEYIDNSFMYRLAKDGDPRTRYYFYRQAEYSDLNNQTTPCQSRTDCKSWEALLALNITGYIGRDHGDPTSVPQDNRIKSVIGLYPIGGKFDNNSFRTVNQNSTNPASKGASGVGITVMMSNVMVNHMLAEVKLKLPGVTLPLEAKDYFLKGLEDHLDKVRAFAEASSEFDYIRAFEADSKNALQRYETLKTAFIKLRTDEFDAASSDEDKLELIINEKYISNFGSSIEVYNDLRRTGFPKVPASLAPSGPFPNRYLLPQTEVNGNPKAPEAGKNVINKVFWDK